MGIKNEQSGYDKLNVSDDMCQCLIFNIFLPWWNLRQGIYHYYGKTEKENLLFCVNNDIPIAWAL